MAISNLLNTQSLSGSLSKLRPLGSMGQSTAMYQPAPTGSFSSAPIAATAPQPSAGLVSSQPTSYQSQSYTAPQPTPSYTPPAATTQTQPPTGTRGLFSNVVSSLANRGTTPNQQAQDYTAQAAQYGAGAIPIAEQARDIANQFGQKYAEVGQAGARFRAGQLTTGTSPVAEGNAAVTAQSTAAQQTALAQGQQAALQGIGYQLTGQQQAQQAANAAAGQAYTGQGLEQQALQQAGSLSQPSQNFPFVFDPTTSSYTAPGVGGAGIGAGLTGNPATDAQTFAQQVINHQIPYADAVRSLGYAGPTAEAALQQAIVQGGGNLTQLQAQTGVQTSQEAQVQGYKSALQQGQNLQSQLTDLITTFGLNPNDLNAANIAIQKIATNISDPRYQQLSNYINDIANTYAQILTPPGGAATDTTRSIAASMLDATAKGSSLISTMKALDNAANAKIAGVQTITPSGGSSGSSGSSVGWY